MIKFCCNFIVLYLTLSILFACANKEDQDSQTNPDPSTADTTAGYTNPVFEPILADPTLVQSGAYFYAYGTEDNWGNEGGYHLVPVIRSKDLVNWELLGDAFQTKPKWKSKGGIWAPDVTEVKGKFYMYYSFSTWGDPDPGIGLAIANTPEGPFADQGKVFLSSEIGVANSIDPFFIEEAGRKYLLWGSFHGIYAVPLTDDGKAVSGEKTQIAADHLEATYIYKKEDMYYLFGSYGSCCEGANSTYQVMVGRSENLLGPYVDKQGNKMTDGHYGEVLLHGNDRGLGFAGPGHNAEIVTDEAGTDWFLYHAMRKAKPLTDNGTNRRSLMLDKITWENGWPVISGQQPSTSKQSVPVFKSS